MPELPEVETIVRALRSGGRILPDGSQTPAVLGRVIQSAHVLWPRTVAEPLPEEFEARLPGQRVESVARRGKFLVFTLDPDSLLIHLRMSGDLWVEDANAEIAPHHRMMIVFDDGLRLAFNDPRKFGRVWLTHDPDSILADLGPEPLDPSFTSEELGVRLRTFKRQLKPLLLDQRFLAGMGNIYSDEALHLARLHPLRLSHTLTDEETRRLWVSIRRVLEEGIRRQGASIDWVYRGGDFQNYFRAYGRTGEPCPACGAPIQRTTVGQRGTHFCSTCQPFE